MGLVVAGAALLAQQTALSQIGVKEQQARAWVDRIVGAGGAYATDGRDDPEVAAVLEMWHKLPAAAKGPLTTQLYAWAKVYTSTPAFKADYQKNRTAAKPSEFIPTETVDQELKTKIATETASMEQSWKYMEANGMKELAAQQRKEFTDRLNKELTPAWRTEIEQRRQTEKDGYAQGLKDWQARYLPDSDAVIARALREFLANSANVDYTAKKGPLMNGAEFGFLNSAYREKPWQWNLSWEFGPEAIGAARTAAAAWLAGLGK